MFTLSLRNVIGSYRIIGLNAGLKSHSEIIIGLQNNVKFSTFYSKKS